MRIRIADNNVFKGTPEQIVRRMRAKDQEGYDSLEEYIRHCVTRLIDVSGETIELVGKTEEELCESLLEGLVRVGYAKLEIQTPEDIDKHAVTLLRAVLGYSQERFAREIGVTFATVNRWERGRTRPNSTVISDRISRVIDKVVQ